MRPEASQLIAPATRRSLRRSLPGQRAHQKDLPRVVGTARIRCPTQFDYSLLVVDFEGEVRYKAGAK
jgi:hypothetical protein